MQNAVQGPVPRQPCTVNIDQWNDEMQAFAQRWERWMQTPYPRGWGGVNITGCEMVLIDADIATLIRSAVERGPLRPQAAAELARLLNQLHQSLPSITADAATYFNELADLAAEAIRLADTSASR